MHPDRAPSVAKAATVMFKRIQGAYEVLSDQGKRARYDRVNGFAPERKAEVASGYQVGDRVFISGLQSAAAKQFNSLIGVVAAAALTEAGRVKVRISRLGTPDIVKKLKPGKLTKIGN